MHNEVLEDGRQKKLDLTRLIKTFTLDLVTEYNLEVRCFFTVLTKATGEEQPVTFHINL